MLRSYQNGNYRVEIGQNGSRVKYYDGELSPEFPDNVDVKITNYCNSGAGCMLHCHERSNPNGKHADLLQFVNFFEGCNGGEIALGGGATQKHPQLFDFCRELQRLNFIPNATINQWHFQEDVSTIQRLISENYIYGIGVSYISPNISYIKKTLNDYEHLVFHLILGIHTIDDVLFLRDHFNNCKILLLGYKQFGNGINFYKKHEVEISNKIYQWFTRLHELFNLSNLTLSFDNLAIEQLRLQRFFTKEKWSEFYQGNDGEANLFIDLVRKEYSISSRSSERFPLKDNIKDCFQHIRQVKELLK